MQNKKIPRHIDAIPQIFFWELDEAILVIAGLGFGFFLGGFYSVLGLCLGIWASNSFKRYKDGGLPGQLEHLAHWKNIFNLNKKNTRSGARSLNK